MSNQWNEGAAALWLLSSSLLPGTLVATQALSVNYVYDEIGRLVSADYSAGSEDRGSIDYTYDPAGNLRSV